MQAYHDLEWGVAVHEDRHLFEMLLLDGAQAGLSWSTILNKREGYREAFHNFDPVRVASLDERDIDRLLQFPGIVRNRAKIASAIGNARATLQIVEEHGDLSTYLWSFVGGSTIHNKWESWEQIPAATDESRAMSLDLRKRGFRFVGPTICYAFMQSAGMVNDHVVSCFRYQALRHSRPDSSPR